MIVKILTVVVAAAVVAGAGVGLVVSTDLGAGTARDQAATLLKEVGSDTSQIDDAIQEPGMQEITSNASHPDFAGAKKRFDDYLTLVDRTRSMAAADAARVGSADKQLQSYRSNPLTLPVRPSLDSEERDVAHMRAALGGADRAMSIERDQARTLSALLDGLIDLQAIGDRFTANDFVGGIAMISGADAKLASADQLAKAANNPVQIDLLISAVRSTLKSFQAFLQAVQRNDVRAEQSILNQAEGDQQRVEDLSRQLPFYEQEFYQLHIDFYRQELRAAGFTYPTRKAGVAVSTHPARARNGTT